MSICLISANFGGFDSEQNHVPQDIEFESKYFTDTDISPRINSLHPRLQAKIPKCFGWQLAPGHEYYMWLDGSLFFIEPYALSYFRDQCDGYDLVVIKHPIRPDIKQEFRYTRKGVKQQRIYLHSRYLNEDYYGCYEEILSDKDYVDDLLVMGGIFMYRNTPEVRKMLKEWWYFISRYASQDQLSFPYVIKKSGIKYKVLDINIREGVPFLSGKHHLKKQ